MFQVQNLDRSQELGILHEGTEVKLKTSPMGSVLIKIRFYVKAHSRNKNGKGRWTQ